MDTSEDQLPTIDIPSEDDDIVVVGTVGARAEDIIFLRYTLKLSFTVHDSIYKLCINKLKAIFNTIQYTGDRKSFLVP